MKVLLIDLSSAYFPPPKEYRNLLRLKFKAQDMIKDQWNTCLRRRGSITYSRGLLSIAASLERAGHQVTYKHCGFGSEVRISPDVVQDAGIVGVTCVTPTFPMAVGILGRIKVRNPHIVAVLGGSHATYLAEDIVTEYAPLIDVVVRGEGEITMTEIANHPNNLQCVKGITYHVPKRSGRTSVCRNPDQDICELSELPRPAYHLLPFPLSHYSHNVMTSRGCVFKCTYCVDGQYFAGFRHHPVGEIVDELKYIAERVPEGTLVHFCDSIFNIDKKYLRELSRGIRVMAPGLRFSCDLQVGTIDEESIELMNSSGFIQYCVGVENSDGSLLAKHKQKQRLQDSIDACKLIRGVDSRAFIIAYWITGLPGTAPQSLRDEVKVMKSLIRENIVNLIGNKVFVPYPGTPIFDHAEQFHLHIRHRDWSKYLRHCMPVYDLDTLTAESLFDDLLAQDKALLDTYCDVLGVGLAELDEIVPNDYLYRQFFTTSSLE